MSPKSNGTLTFGSWFAPSEGMRVRLRKKFAEMIDGIDLTRHKVGDYLLLRVEEAALLIAEGWAELAERRRVPRPLPS